ncbi:MAG: hypothetical protein AB1631_11050 [Acidobacteriota bacterium]
MKNEEQESEEDFRLGKNKKRWAFIILFVVLLLWAASWISTYIFLPDWQTRSNFGEMFGAINALFSGAALSGVVYTIWLQQEELRLQRLELQLTRKELSRTAEAQEKSEKALNSQAEALAHQIRVSMMPTILVELDKVQPDTEAYGPFDVGLRLRLANGGNGIAINVKVDDIHIPPASDEPLPDNADEELREIFLNRNVAFKTIPFIRPKESTVVEHTSRFGNSPAGLNFLLHLKEDYAKDRLFIVRVKFDDIEGNHYEQSCQMGKGGYKLGSVKLVGTLYD